MDLEKLTREEREYQVFRKVVDAKSSIDSIYRTISILLDNPKNIEFMSTMSFADLLRDINNDGIKNRKKHYDVFIEYQNILQNMKKLSKELNLYNSLELSNLYTYLLHIGYLSRKKEYNFCNTKKIKGLYFADIMNGKAVCLNHADMLKDFLNLCGYNSSILINMVDEVVKSKKIGRMFGDHAFNLIQDNNKLYIFDSTNYSLIHVLNPYMGEDIIHERKHILNPYYSYSFNNIGKERNALDKLLTTKDYTSPYTDYDFIQICNNNAEIFADNVSLIEDFYTEVRPSIVSISEKTDKIKSRKRYR